MGTRLRVLWASGSSGAWSTTAGTGERAPAKGMGRVGNTARLRHPVRGGPTSPQRGPHRTGSGRFQLSEEAISGTLLKNVCETSRVPIKRSVTRGPRGPTRETPNPLHEAGLRPFLRSAGSITVTSASPDHELPRRWPPSAYCRPTLARLRSPQHRLRRFLSTRDWSARRHPARDAHTFKRPLPADQCHDPGF